MRALSIKNQTMDMGTARVVVVAKMATALKRGYGRCCKASEPNEGIFRAKLGYPLARAVPRALPPRAPSVHAPLPPRRLRWGRCGVGVGSVWCGVGVVSAWGRCGVGSVPGLVWGRRVEPIELDITCVSAHSRIASASTLNKPTMPSGTS